MKGQDVATIGVAGHRSLANLDEIHEWLQEVIRRLEAAYPEPWTVVSSLAEGSDRLLTLGLLDRPDSRLVAVLPLPAEDYETDFDTEASRAGFEALLARAAETIEIAGYRDRVDAYEAAGRAVLDRSDVVVVIWDGRSGRGRGGTASFVAEARVRDLPLAWIHAGNAMPDGNIPVGLGPDQGRVTLERFPVRKEGTPVPGERGVHTE